MKIVRYALIVLAVLLGLAATVVIRFDRPAEEIDASYRTDQSHFVELADGTRMHYLEAGAADAPVLVLVHGSYDTAFTWEHVMPALAEHFRVIAPDLPAHGLTGRTPADDYTMDAMVGAVHGLVEQLGIERFHLAGNSMGGNTAWLYALQHPERVARMVLIDASGYPSHGSATLTDPNPGAVMRWLYRNGNPVTFVRRGFDNAVADTSLVSDALVQRSVDLLRRQGSRDAHALRREQRHLHEQPFQRIGEIATDTLIVWGDQDALVPVSSARRFHADLKHSELVIYEGIGHLPQLEAPARLTADMQRFLRAPEPQKPQQPEPAAQAAAPGTQALAPSAAAANAPTVE